GQVFRFACGGSHGDPSPEGRPYVGPSKGPSPATPRSLLGRGPHGSSTAIGDSVGSPRSATEVPPGSFPGASIAACACVGTGPRVLGARSWERRGSLPRAFGSWQL